MSSPRPLWRWWLFCVLLEMERRAQWEWLREAWVWCILPEWHGVSQQDLNDWPPEDSADAPF